MTPTGKSTMRKLATESQQAPYDLPRMLPTFNLTEKDLPAIKNWKVGGKYTLSIEVEMVGQAKNEYSPSPLESRFKITKIGEKEMLTDDEKKGRMGHY